MAEQQLTREAQGKSPVGRNRGCLLYVATLAAASTWIVLQYATSSRVGGDAFLAPTETSNRRAAFLSGLTAAVAGTSSAGAYDLPTLPYDYAALEPAIDKETMTIHHDKHHSAYVKNLNTALEGKDMPSITELQKGALKAGGAVRNNGGGVFNHDMFWQVMAPKGQGGEMSAKLKGAIEASFGGMEDFKKAFAKAGTTRFGSGWAWLVVDGSGKLQITSTPNQDNPLMEGVDAVSGIPVLGLDVWEHAYYLKYQNKRPDYINAWWDVVNWGKVSAFYDDALKGKAPAF